MIPKIGKILYATDLSKNSSYAFFYAADMARRHDATIVILHVVESLRDASYAYSGVGARDLAKGDEERKQEAGLKEIAKRVEEFRKSMEAYLGPSSELVSKVLVPMGHPVEEILEAADEEGCDALVLGTHGKGFLKQTFLGSMAVKVLERTRKPVFIIPLPSGKVDWESYQL